MGQKHSQDKERLYFAYGSNLSTTQMRNRCPSSTPIGLAQLTGWTWIINERGYANIVQNEYKSSLQTRDTEDQVETNEGHDSSWDQPWEIVSGPGVYGLVYRLHPDDEETLDRCEGVGYAYEREVLDVAWVDVSNSGAGQGSSAVTTSASVETESTQPAEKTKKQSHEGTTSVAPGETIQVLVYIDFQRITPSIPKDEYVGRMNLGIKEVTEQWGLPRAYVDEVIRPYIPVPKDASQAAA
ncbi:hypothetical protein FHL15_009396 [Xylaria flabelliformis]|uniref:gamma-glutamylcyclotransferase n=1 Tax=Xylaria flabelliformis TaxID=2512241 RepID=A0A553HNX2_9PEZI|nr:hypothetical protein FHL15_009396 [Xylaria flabelliformis]